MANTVTVAKLLPLCLLCLLCLAAEAAQAAHSHLEQRHFWHTNEPHRRSLLQDALSNSNGCLSTILKCEAGACATRNIMGTGRWVCLRCSANYEPVVDASGQDNIIQCVCPQGFYEATAAATSCTRCPADNYCPGGQKIENPTSRGALVQCGDNLVTRNTGARSQADCVARAGYAMASATAATACPPSSYAPQFNRLARCLRCQSGLGESPTSGLNDGDRTSKRIVCKVPPGKYMSQGLIRSCPQGFYRERYLDFDHPNATICVACNPGITTAGAEAKLAAECNIVISGFGIMNLLNVTGPQSLPTLPQNGTNGLPTASVCGLGFYSGGGYCLECPAGTVTMSFGATSVEECSIPPGYFIRDGSMVKCTNGQYRQGWLMNSDPRALNCTPCGDNIASEPRDMDQHPFAVNGSLVRATPASCYIDAGQGMIVRGQNAFAASDCPINTYGVSGRIYGLQASPCKPCPRNMVTDRGLSTSMADCLNPDGFGYASEGASRCAVGFYCLRGSKKPCTKCPDGRTTFDAPDKQRLILDCLVAPGNGVIVNAKAGISQGTWDLYQDGGLTNIYSDMEILAMDVLQCPPGYYSSGNRLDAVCRKCPGSSTTKDPGATDISQCDVCKAGYGQATPGADCTLCTYGTWQPGGFATCITCDNSTFYTPVDGKGQTWTSPGTTFDKGAVGPEWCVPMQSQLSPEAGQAFFSADLMAQPQLLSVNQVLVPDLESCMANCAANMCCMMQLNIETNRCSVATLPPASTDPSDLNPVLFYKLPAAGLSSAASIKTPSSGSGGGSSSGNGASSGPVSGAVAGTVARSATAKGRSSVRPVRLSRAALRGQGALQAAVPGGAKKAGAGAGRKHGVARASGSNSDGMIKAKMLASGSYATCSIDSSQQQSWQQVGTPLTADARTFSKDPEAWFRAPGLTTYRCAELCDESNVCWGFIYDKNNIGCLFRGGEDSLKTRSFFQLPLPGSATGINSGVSTYWYAFTASGLVPGDISNTITDSFSAAVTSVVAATNLLPNAAVQDGPSTFTTAAFDASSITTGNPLTDIVLVALLWDKPSAAAYQRELDSIFASDSLLMTTTIANATFTGAVAAGETGFYGRVIMLATASQDANLVYQGMGAQAAIDGCKLLPNYCGTNGNGTCVASVCSCQANFSGPTCSTATGR